uniref:Uncharacterized protein n=1 Tax=Rhizophora mucronata TaxID=61149 RepID=A0A2P2JQA2_RHIMU
MLITERERERRYLREGKRGLVSGGLRHWSEEETICLLAASRRGRPFLSRRYHTAKKW